MERDYLQYHNLHLQNYFNSHAHVERDKNEKTFLRLDLHFNSHAHVERDGCENERIRQGSKFQLTRSRGAWHILIAMPITVVNFNSHAHVERDLYMADYQDNSTISTHTLTWSVTFFMSKSTRYKIFQLTRSRGAWRPYRLFLRDHAHFNSHAHVERDQQFPLWYPLACQFQLTRSRGAWRGETAVIKI